MTPEAIGIGIGVVILLAVAAGLILIARDRHSDRAPRRPYWFDEDE